jgi:hypothetical protein
VTVTQLVATKSALVREIPLVVDHGNMSNAVPAPTSAKNP